MTDNLKTQLESAFRGPVISRSDADYDDAHALYKGMIPPLPWQTFSSAFLLQPLWANIPKW